MKKIKHNIIKSMVLASVVLLLTNCSKDDTPDLGLKPEADFEASAIKVEQGATVTFSDISTNTPTLWTWNFEGGSPTYSNKPNPEVLYVVKGKHAVTLTVRNKAGATEITKTGFIEVTAPPIVDIDLTPKVQLNFETNLNNDGAVGGEAVAVAGGAKYELRTYAGGLAMEFDGTTHLTIPGYTGINGAGTRSVALWIKVDEAKTKGLVHWGNAGTFSRASFKQNGGGGFRFEYQGGGHTSPSSIDDGEWHHIAYTYDGSTIKLYLDGVEDFTVSGVTLNTGNTGETDVNIGSQLGGSVFKGYMDDVRIYTEVLTPDQVKILSEIK